MSHTDCFCFHLELPASIDELPASCGGKFVVIFTEVGFAILKSHSRLPVHMAGSVSPRRKLSNLSYQLAMMRLRAEASVLRTYVLVELL